MLNLIQEKVTLADKNWFQTGGPARYFAEPTNDEQFVAALEFARCQNIPVFVLGQGANILISDDGFDGLVIRPQLKEIVHATGEDGSALIEVGAGWTMHDLIDYCLEHGLSGLEEFSGIPGTVGGSVYINLHYFQYLLQHFMVRAKVIEHHSGAIKIVDREWFNFGYDQSKLLDKEHYLLSATFALKKISPIDVAYAKGRRTEIIRHRASRYPTTHTCGSFFRNFHDHEVTYTSAGKKMMFVAYYLDKIGVKGALKVGGAQVSWQHANMLVNTGTATSKDLIQLARKMQELVFNQFQILPQPECQLIGFKEHPLLRPEDVCVHRSTAKNDGKLQPSS